MVGTQGCRSTTNRRLEGRTGKRQSAGTCQRPEQRRRNHRPCVRRQRVEVRRDQPTCRHFRRRHHLGARCNPIARHHLFTDRKRAMRRGDQRGAVRRDKAAKDRPARLHHLGGDHHIDIACRWHQRKHRLACRGRAHLDVVNRSAGPLRHPGNRSRLHHIALRPRGGLDPAGQHAAALPADRQHRQFDDPTQNWIEGGRISGDRVQQAHAPNSNRRAARLRCSQPITAARNLAIRASNGRGLCTTSAR